MCNVKYRLLCATSPQLFFSLALRLLAGSLLRTLLSGSDSRYDVIEWIVNYPNGLDFGWALGSVINMPKEQNERFDAL